MPEFKLDPRLARDCHALGTLNGCQLLLMNSAQLPWFILVPETGVTEFHRMTAAEQARALEAVNRLSAYIEKHFRVDKLNIACIGNIVEQLHIHVIGRHREDPCWPGVVWGKLADQPYEPAALDAIRSACSSLLADDQGTAAS